MHPVRVSPGWIGVVVVLFRWNPRQNLELLTRRLTPQTSMTWEEPRPHSVRKSLRPGTVLDAPWLLVCNEVHS